MSENNALSVKRLSNYLQLGTKSLAKVANSSITPERLIRIACAAATKNPKLAQCDPKSLLIALMDCAASGLEPFTHCQHASIIPYGKDAQFQAGYRGLVHLAIKSGIAKSVAAHVVYEGDEFEVELGVSPAIKHRPKWSQNDRGEPVAVYAIVTFQDGRYQFDVMSRADVENTRKMSKSPNSPGWSNFWGEMAKKCVTKRLLKYIDASDPSLARAINTDNKNETGIDDGTIDVDIVELNLPEPPADILGDANAEFEGRKQKIRLRCQLLRVDKKVQDDIVARIEKAVTHSELDSVEAFILPILKEGAKNDNSHA